jgi:signal transduction histidine kinase
MSVDSDPEVVRLRTVLGDLVALSTIPAAWVGRDPREVAAGLADVLIALLDLDFDFVRLRDPGGVGAVDASRGNAWHEFPEWLERRLATNGMFSLTEIIRDVGDEEFRSGVLIPIGVNAEGGLVAGASERPDFPTDIEQLLLSLAANHAATAYQNARLILDRRSAEEELLEARNALELKVAERTADLAASRARIVATADETRRQIERDLHDGVQQRLVSLGIELRVVEAAMPPDDELRAKLVHAGSSLASAVDDLLEVSRGIHPAVLSEGGLGPALNTLANRASIPVELDLRTHGRLPGKVEVAVYYVVSEALTNIAKHARASVVHVDLEVEDSIVRVAIRDDGVGGADSARGSGLVGLTDRVEALDGRIEIASPAGRGTWLLIEIPVEPALTGAARPLAQRDRVATR